jgi:hypothetical protein
MERRSTVFTPRAGHHTSGEVTVSHKYRVPVVLLTETFIRMECVCTYRKRDSKKYASSSKGMVPRPTGASNLSASVEVE